MKQIFFFRNTDSGDKSGPGPEVNSNGSPAKDFIKSKAAEEGFNSSPGPGGVSAGISPLDEEIARQKFGEQAQQRIRDFRVRIDSLYLTAKQLTHCRENALAVTALQSARQNCGIVLGELGASYPYPTMNTPGPVTGQRSDKGEEIESILEIVDQTEMLRAFRDKIEDVITDFNIYMENSVPNSPKQFVAQIMALSGLMSGKMWLGERMAEINGVS